VYTVHLFSKAKTMKIFPSNSYSICVLAVAATAWLIPYTANAFHTSTTFLSRTGSIRAGTIPATARLPLLAVSKKSSWNEEHLAHGASEIHEETPEELLDSEDAAAWDAHDAPDAGMEAAAEERAVMLAAELVHKMKHKKQSNQGTTRDQWNEAHLARDSSEIHEETPEELLESEDAAAWDAHDAPDAGMEAAAEERAVMLAAELVQKLKQKKASDTKG
jgi:hypothetical protein